MVICYTTSLVMYITVNLKAFVNFNVALILVNVDRERDGVEGRIGSYHVA